MTHRDKPERFPIFQNMRTGIRDLLPTYFALVMATGIVSIAADLYGMTQIADALFILNWTIYFILLLLFALRFLFYRQQFVADISDHARGAGFFTIVAATCLLGSQCIVLQHGFGLAKPLWIISVVLWLVIVYAFFAAITIRTHKPTLEKGINGIWLISAVATQAVSVLGTLISDQFGDLQEVILFITLSLFCIGSVLYFLIITLIFYRLTFFELVAGQFAPPYWINMGALAISTLASLNLVMKASQWSFLLEISPFLKAATVLFWAMGTWWIPLIVILGGWRHVSGKLPLTYHPQYWGMVFPLGMYTVATFRMIDALKFDFLTTVPAVFVYVAMGAWTIAFVGLLKKIADGFRPLPVSARSL